VHKLERLGDIAHPLCPTDISPSKRGRGLERITI